MRKLLLLAVLYPGCAIAAPPKLLPMPQHVAEHRGDFVLSPSDSIRVPPHDEGAKRAASYLSALLSSSNHLQLKVGSSGGAIRFVRKRSFEPEGYTVEARPGSVTISATTDAGMLYGAVTLWQLASGDKPNFIPAVTIRDAPAFRWRGLMLDSARHFQSPEFIRKLIE
jgi:hexosaminidase